ncbi:MAG: GatB/YqeY protein [Alphaproteobacteria bacterium]|nr:GatB/YqeY protein [Alphaproteobacteria bacterium]MDB5720887.1 GatB/YqeY protein [Alphaproteobacteria bacterium]
MAGTPFNGFDDVAKARPLDSARRTVNLLNIAKPGYAPPFPLERQKITMIRDRIKAELVSAMKSGDKSRTATIRLIQSSIKNRDIELRTGTAPTDDDVLVTEVLQKMIKQRRESVALYEQGGRQELADAEKAEVAVIENFLPAQMDEEAARAAIDSIVAETGAASVKDMGKVMALVKERFAGQLDMSKASGLVKARLG